ncbi:uncharacterized protein M6B38_287090 [Iris pallida]|uniref:BURP domain-containing protein n=2 Tax=Iris pallida TaxID=29817 RepID=A0AAX6HY38_IRIPA|nr:uncharacterized protein M6B38_287090 [Iris pallida]
MARFLLLSFLMIGVAVAAVHAAHPAEDYWNEAFPNTPMPSAIQYLLQTTDVNVDELKGSTVNVGSSNYQYASAEPYVHGDPKGSAVNYNYASAENGDPKGSAVNYHYASAENGDPKGSAVNYNYASAENRDPKGSAVNYHYASAENGDPKGSAVNYHYASAENGDPKGSAVNYNYASAENGDPKGSAVNYHYASAENGDPKGSAVNYNYASAENRDPKGSAVNYHYASAENGDPKGSAVNYNYASAENGDPKGSAVNYHYASAENGDPKGSAVNYNYASAETYVHGNPAATLFFLERDLRPGTNMTLHFTRTRTTSGAPAPLLPRRVASSIPFSSAKLPEILSRFSIRPNSEEADAVRSTLRMCEEPANDGETKFCATSLESMADLSASRLGTFDIRAVSTSVAAANGGATPEQVYTVAVGGVRSLAATSGSELVVCHALAYAHAVFYCHRAPATRAYRVALVGEDGTKADTVAVCHTDTAKWNPNRIAFQVLGVRPGSEPICHFLPEDHLVWIGPRK